MVNKLDGGGDILGARFAMLGNAYRSSRPWTWAGGEVASTAVNSVRIRYECSAPTGTNQESPVSSLTVCPSTASSASPARTYPTVS